MSMSMGAGGSGQAGGCPRGEGDTVGECARGGEEVDAGCRECHGGRSKEGESENCFCLELESRPLAHRSWQESLDTRAMAHMANPVIRRGLLGHSYAVWHSMWHPYTWMRWTSGCMDMIVEIVSMIQGASLYCLLLYCEFNASTCPRPDPQ